MPPGLWEVLCAVSVSQLIDRSSVYPRLRIMLYGIRSCGRVAVLNGRGGEHQTHQRIGAGVEKFGGGRICWDAVGVLEGAVEVDGFFYFCGSWYCVGDDFDAILSAAGDSDAADVEDAIEEGLIDLDVADVIVQDLGA